MHRNAKVSERAIHEDDNPAGRASRHPNLKRHAERGPRLDLGFNCRHDIFGNSLIDL
jgi:hypothetical protein